jgi:hypothetical protein
MFRVFPVVSCVRAEAEVPNTNFSLEYAGKNGKARAQSEGKWNALWLATKGALGKASTALRPISHSSQNCEKRLWASSCPFARPQRTRFRLDGFHEILYLTLSRKSIERIQVSLKYDKNNGDFTCIPMYIFMIKSHWLILRITDKSSRENQNTFYVQQHFSSENRAVYEIMLKNMVQPDRPQTTT